MKNLLILPFFIFFLQSHAQNSEWRLKAGSSLMSFIGPSATAETFINGNPSYFYLNNPYGSKKGWGFGGAISYKHKSKKHFIAGMDLGYERLKSRVSVTSINISDFPPYSEQATGSGYVAFDFITAFPFVGYRFPFTSGSVDLTVGLENAYTTRALELVKAKGASGSSYEIVQQQNKTNWDQRFAIQLDLNLKQFGFYAACAWGTSNNLQPRIGSSNQAVVSVIRAGLTFHLRSLKNK